MSIGLRTIASETRVMLNKQVLVIHWTQKHYIFVYLTLKR
jgi:hypothetical protein